ncbi:MAG: hypothetical protein M3124_00220 [Actinomycetota bacterium]|nr:hypothetical protein [Actinomycetota bacterium]
MSKEGAGRLHDGWYLMSISDLDRELRRWRSSDCQGPPSRARRLTNEAAIAYRNAGNLPDELDRTLRLVLVVNNTEDLANLEARRLTFEPDYLDAPTWRREGSRPINVVPLRSPRVEPVTAGSWWDDPQLEALEREYTERGTAGGLRIPGEYRGFIFKTVLALRSQDREITPQAIADSVARWLPKDDAARLEAAIAEANR